MRSANSGRASSRNGWKPSCSIPSGAEATFAPFGVGGKFVDRRERDVFNSLNHKLGNPFAAHNLEVLG